MRTSRSSGGLKNFLRAAWNAPVNVSKRIVCKILYDGCFVAGTPVLMAPQTIAQGGRAIMVASLPLLAVPIEDVPLLSYALTNVSVSTQDNSTAASDTYSGLLTQDPFVSPQQRERDRYEINDTDWYEVSMEQVAGTSSCRFALHKDWIAEQGYASGAIVEMHLPEQGISGPFRITSIKHILPQKKPEDEGLSDNYEYQPVTGLFMHQSEDVWDVVFDNGDTLGITSAHPIYSVTYGGWRLAGEVEVGEKLLTRSGELIVSEKEKQDGTVLVYNLEVKDVHNFFVGDNGLLVHNGCAGEIAEILSIDLSKLIKAKRADNIPYNRILMKQGGEIDHKDAQFLDDIASIIGDDIVLPPVKNNPGFDGFAKTSGKTIEVKVLESTTVIGQQKGVINRAKEAYDQIKASGKTPKTDVRIKADKITKSEAQAAWNGSTDAGTYNKPNDEWVEKIIVHCKDGTITLKN